MRLSFALLGSILIVGQVLAGPREAFAAAFEDARRLPPEDVRQTRYLYRPGGFLPGEYEAVSYHANQLSRRARLVPPRRLNGELVAVELDAYQWDKKVWEKLAETEPYFTIRTESKEQKYYAAGNYGGKYYPAGNYPITKIEVAPNPKVVDPRLHASLQTLTFSLVPVVRADWWLANTSRQVNLRNKDVGIGYYEWLGIKDRAAFVKLARFNDKDSEALGRNIRAVMDRSGVAQHGRQIAGFDALTGKVFMTMDAETLEADNLPTELLKPGAFRHAAEEWFLQAPNGLWLYGLFNAAGARQATAPDFIGPDDSPLRAGRDGRIHVGLSCVRCHIEDGLRPIDDWARRTFRGRVRNDIVGREEKLEFEQLYLSNLERKLEDGRRIYREALIELLGVGWDGKRTAEAFARAYNRYAEDAVDVKKLAVELGLAELELHARLKGARLPISLAPLLQVDGVVRREIAEDFWPVLTLSVLGVP